jgi:hypothetical protein
MEVKTMTWTKGTFEMVARVIREASQRITKNDTLIAYHQTEMVSTLARDFADQFTASNGRFNRARFLKACGVKTE